MSNSILLFGAGGHCRSCIAVVESCPDWKIAGIAGLPAEVGGSVLGYDIIGSDDDLDRMRGICDQALITVGQLQSAAVRCRLYEKLRAAGFRLPSLVASTAFVSGHADVGPGTIVMHHAFVNAGARVGENCIINTRAVIEHDANIGDSTHVSTGAIVNGGVTIGERTLVGSSAVVIQERQVGSDVVVAAGAVVTTSISDGMRVAGVPAVPIRRRS